MSIPMIIGLISIGVLALIFLIVSGNKNLNKKAKEKTDRIKHLDGRINILEVESELKKMPIKRWDKHLDDIQEKFNLIDGLSDIQKNIQNYDETIEQLDKLSLFEVRSNVERIRKQFQNAKNEKLRQDGLKEKYGEELADKLIKGEYFIGMTEEQLIDSKGDPTKIEQEVMKTKTKMIYIYGNKNSGDVFTFVNGELERFMDR